MRKNDVERAIECLEDLVKGMPRYKNNPRIWAQFDLHLQSLNFSRTVRTTAIRRFQDEN